MGIIIKVDKTVPLKWAPLVFQRGEIMERKESISVSIHGKKQEIPFDTCYLELAKKYQPQYENDIVLVIANGKLQELNKSCKEDGQLEFVTTGDHLGKKVYERSMVFLLLKAAYDVAGEGDIEHLRVEFSLQQGLYCRMRGKKTPTQEYLDLVASRMKELCKGNIPILKHTISTEEAMADFSKRGMLDKAKLFSYRRSSHVNVYDLDGFKDYFYGYMVPSTGYLKYFSLHPYKEGFVLQLPTRKQPKVVSTFVPYEKLFHVEERATKWGEMLGVDTVGALNDQIKEESINELVLVQEALQEKEIVKIAEQIYEQRKRLILIAGPSSSGKTTFSHRLAVQLKTLGFRPHPIPVDDYFVNRDQTPVDEYGQQDFESLEAIDVSLFNKDMGRLLAGEPVQLPTYNFVTGKREYKTGKCLQIGDQDLLLIEGIHCLNEKLTHSLPRSEKFKIYISALTTLNIDEHNRIPTTDGRLIRRMVRDARTRGTDAKSTIARWPSVRRGEEKNIFPYQEEADVMFNSALLYELAVLKQYAEPALHSIDKGEPEYIEAKRLLKFLDYFIGIGSEKVPNNSILREFIGQSAFEI